MVWEYSYNILHQQSMKLRAITFYKYKKKPELDARLAPQ